jgi:hypothetical protein
MIKAMKVNVCIYWPRETGTTSVVLVSPGHGRYGGAVFLSGGAECGTGNHSLLANGDRYTEESSAECPTVEEILHFPTVYHDG